MEIPVQVNGKLRDVIKVPANADNATIEAAAKASEKVQQFIAGKTIKKVIVVPKKLVNLIVADSGFVGRRPPAQLRKFAASLPRRRYAFSPPARIVWKCGGCSSAATMLISIFLKPAASSQRCKSLSAKPGQRSP